MILDSRPSAEVARLNDRRGVLGIEEYPQSNRLLKVVQFMAVEGGVEETL